MIIGKKKQEKRNILHGFISSKLVYSDRRQISSCIAIDREWRKGIEGGITKVYSEILGGDRCVYYFDCGNSFISVDICKSFSDCIL